MSDYIKYALALMALAVVAFIGGYVYQGEKSNLDKLLRKDEVIFVFPNDLVIQETE